MSYLTADIFAEAWAPYADLVKASPGKSILEQQSVLLRFLSFSMLAKDLDVDKIDLAGYSENRSRLIAEYQRLTSVGGNNQLGVYIEHQGTLTTRSPTAKIASDFLTSQLKKATESSSDKSKYPRRPASSPLLWLYKDWSVGFHEDWAVHLDKYILKNSRSPYHDLFIVLFHDEEFDSDLNLSEALSQKCSSLFTSRVATFLNKQLASETVGYEASPFSTNPIERNWILEYIGQSTERIDGGTGHQVVNRDVIDPGVDETLSGIVAQFCGDATQNNLRVDEKFANRFLCSLLAKRFLIATGLSGSGKTKLAQAFAHWITPADEQARKCYELVAVGADWVGSDSVLGYPSGLDPAAYVTKPALDLIIHAKERPSQPHFLILDEMNLSHVERYFADFLSAIESGEDLHLHPDNERQAHGVTVPGSIGLPQNIFIIGTVNVDETTYMFSPKVLDRANVLEFRMSSEDLVGFLGNSTKPNLDELAGLGHEASYSESFVTTANHSAEVPTEVKEVFDDELLLFFQALQSHGAEFGYRTAYESGRFIHFYKLLGNHAEGDASWFKDAFDCVIVQKLLPKLHGSRAKLGPVLKKLWFLCVTDTSGRSDEPLKDADDAARSTDKKSEPVLDIPDGAPYPLSAEKIARMWRLLMDNGFASFAEA